MTKYKLLAKFTAEDLTDAVNNALNEGWILCGDTRAIATTCGITFIQAMVKKEE